MFEFIKSKPRPYVVTKTHIGDRDENQDNHTHLSVDGYDCYVVADGLGGHDGGRYASQYLCDAIEQHFPICIAALDTDTPAAVSRLIHDARQTMCERLKELDPELQGQTTVVLAVRHNDLLCIAHVGDSRAYLVQDQTITWQTRDHSLAQLLVEQGQIDKDQAMHDKSQHMLFRSIQCEKEYDISLDTFDHVKSNADNALILCTDGFWTYRNDEDLIDLATAKKPEKILERDFKQILKRSDGESDNITAMVIQF